MICIPAKAVGRRTRACWLAKLLLTGSVLGVSRDASAQVSRFALRAELGGGGVLSSYQDTQLGYGFVLQGAARLGFRVVDLLELQASLGSAYFPVEQRASGQLFTATGGLRFQPRLGRLGRFFVDGHAGLGQTADLSRAALDLGIGFEFFLGESIELGPFVRDAHVFATRGDFPSDAWFWSAGLSLAVHAPKPEAPAPAPRPSRDTDLDGVLDPDDLCPLEPSGAHPDPLRRGCPLRDADLDGVYDPDDLCPSEPAGAHPDTHRPGCPATDLDRDGVFDPEDLCPSRPRGAHPDPDRAGCPDGDDDNDGVLNHQDQCPTVHQGYHPDPRRPGCPLPDRDRDSVPDTVDACPDVPGAPSTDPRRNGCPGLVRVENDRIRIQRPVFFASNRDRILPRSRPVLRAVADALQVSPGILRVSIDGHTDDLADDAFNMDLSQRRANNVMAWLIQNGIEAPRLEAHGHGETRPLIHGTTMDARATNRRVEFQITLPATLNPGVP